MLGRCSGMFGGWSGCSGDGREWTSGPCPHLCKCFLFLGGWIQAAGPANPLFQGKNFGMGLAYSLVELRYGKCGSGLMFLSAIQGPAERHRNPFQVAGFRQLGVAMIKTSFFLLCLLGATAAFGQYGSGVAVLNSQPVIYETPSHPEHASIRPMAQPQSLLEQSGYSYAQGDRPLWEVAPPEHVTPLGDIARELRKEHAEAKKATICWANQ